MDAGRLALAVVGLAACGRIGFDGINDATTSDVGHDAEAICGTVTSTTSDFKAIGSGTVASPWILCTAPQLVALANSASDWSASFAVGADLDLGTSAFPGLGNATIPFTGTFDGQGFTISNVTIDAPAQDGTGFFGEIVSSAALVQRVNLANVAITGRDFTGGLVGLDDRADLIDCGVSGAVTGRENVGGLVGESDQGAIVSSAATNVTVTGSVAVGGVVGLMNSGDEIFTSYARGDVIGGDTVGGLVGNSFGAILDSYATGNVTSINGNAGGLVGYGLGMLIRNSFATGSVTSTTSAVGPSGQLIGAGMIDPGDVVSSYYFGGSICTIGASPCGAPTNGEIAKTPFAYFESAANAPLSSWDLANVWTTTAGALPTLAPKLFDYTAWGDCSTHQTDMPFAGGIGSPEQPFLICTLAQLASMTSQSVLQGKAFRLMSDITFSGTSWTPIGDSTMSARMIFEGNGKSISGFGPSDASGQFYFGLFGSLIGGVKRLGMPNASVQSNSMYTGIIAGVIQGSTVDCFTTGALIGGMYASGLSSTTAGTTVDSYSSANVTSTGGTAAGLSYAPDIVLDSFEAGNVSGVANSGQIAGYDTYTNVPCAQDAAGGAPGSYYDSTSTCTGCCTPAYGTTEPHVWFFDATNPPMSRWDFTHVWQASSSAMPTLR